MHKNTLALAVAVGMVTGCSHQTPLVSSPPVGAADVVVTVSEPKPTADKADQQVLAAAQASAATATEEGITASDSELIWERLRNGMQLDHHDHPGLKKYLEWYSSHQPYFDRVFERASRYLHFITNEVEARDMPLELALLPVVESAFDPFAYSHSHAAGLWQFVPSTGERFGLERNWWYEGRRDIVASTGAALDYLTYLNEIFDGDWLLALAAYNSGEGTVKRAIERNQKSGKEKDFWSLRLPRETRAYVPQLLAVAKIVSAPNTYGIQLADIPNAPYFESIPLDTQIDLTKAAEMAGIELNELYLLNPAYNRWTTAPGNQQQLLLPLENVEGFQKALSEIPREQWLATREYIVRPGDNLGRIAHKNKVSVADLRRENLLNSDLIRVGQVIKIPGVGGTAPLNAQHASYYQVRNGDSLWGIARNHGIQVNDLRAWNNLGSDDVIRPGQQLQVSAVKPMLATRKVNYKVKQGDSLARIANQFNVKIRDIVTWNGINPSHYLQPGQKLKLFIDIRRM